ncbi:murein transglycosylase A [Desulforhabdus sp. TSK]|uniref:murein transglycosylase A n=1 Tax=Desulforhabdus sp. TSK TaxID=2925014 RepID=UPI001FC85FC9|nr:MltA domain-containing protein [Desulforhabdus sp. TSK]GKT08082.1 hypothetical protein DSTSK_13870 [Desulforhabdus sp. TSK]
MHLTLFPSRLTAFCLMPMSNVPARIVSGLLQILLVCLLWSCSPPMKEGPARAPGFEPVPLSEIPAFEDDLDVDSLRQAVAGSISFYDRIPDDRMFSLGDMPLRADQLKATLKEFSKLLDAHKIDPATIARTFDIYRSRSAESSGESLVTGYYEPVLDAAMQRGGDFLYPIYRIPPDLVTIDLASFNPKLYSDQKIVGRVEGSRVVPYYTRQDIDTGKKLETTGCQLAWLKDPIDVFFLQVQGSGMLRLPDGKMRRVGYAGANGHPYRSIGKYLLEKGVMAAEEITLQSLKDYLRNHPLERDEILSYNESYVFFRWIDTGPIGSINVPLTAGRSIATDPQFFPKGALAFLETKKPRLDAQGQVLGWEPLQRWVLNQDTGGAIKGPGRADLFCGTGEAAEWTAGRMKHPGRLYFFLLKK